MCQICMCVRTHTPHTPLSKHTFMNFVLYSDCAQSQTGIQYVWLVLQMEKGYSPKCSNFYSSLIFFHKSFPTTVRWRKGRPKSTWHSRCTSCPLPVQEGCVSLSPWRTLTFSESLCSVHRPPWGGAEGSRSGTCLPSSTVSCRHLQLGL